MLDSDKSPKKITKQLDEFYIGTKSLDEVLDILHNYRYEYGKKYERLHFDIDFYNDEWGRPDSIRIYLKGDRMETWEEAEKRVAEVLKHEDIQRNKMRRDYENLKTIFESEEHSEEATSGTDA